jgi:hypothetical protein
MTPWEEHAARVRGSQIADLRYHWDGAYHFGWRNGRFTATRSDNGAVLTAETAAELSELVRLDYCHHPVPRQ